MNTSLAGYRIIQSHYRQFTLSPEIIIRLAACIGLIILFRADLKRKPLLKFAGLSWRTPFPAALILCAGLALTPIHAEAAYVATELEAMPEGSVSVVRGVNDEGEVVGSTQSGGRHRGMLINGGKRQHINGMAGSDYSTANGINSTGQVVGSTNMRNGMHAYRSKGTTDIVDLGMLPGDSSSAAMAINQSGEAVGYSSGRTGVRAVLWNRAGEIKALPSLPGSLSSKALANNNRGDAVGVAEIPPGPRAVLWEKGVVVRDLGALPGDRASEALSINSKGEIVGSSGDPNEQTRAVLWSPGGAAIRDLGALQGGTSSRALAISNRSEVVGTSHSSDGHRAFLWTPTSGMQNLNDLLTSRSGFVLTQAVAINTKGVIVAIGVDEVVTGEKHEHDLQTRVFRLAPAP